MEAGLIVGLSVFFLGILIGLPLCWVFLGSTLATIALISGSTSFMAGTFYPCHRQLCSDGHRVLHLRRKPPVGLRHRRPHRPPLVRAGGARPRRAGGRRDRGRGVHGRPDRLVAAGHRGADPAPRTPARESTGSSGTTRRRSSARRAFSGISIPPSVPGLLYCLVAQQSVAAVFLSTVIPGLILAVGYIIVNTCICHRYMQPAKDVPVLPPRSGVDDRQSATSFCDRDPGPGMPVRRPGGYLRGIFTPETKRAPSPSCTPPAWGSGSIGNDYEDRCGGARTAR